MRWSIIVVTLAGCTSTSNTAPPVDPTGVYRVDSHVGSQCAIDQPVANPETSLTVTMTADGIKIDEGIDTGGPGFAMSNMAPGRWSGFAANAQSVENGRVCLLTYREHTAVFEGDHLVFEDTTYGIQFGPIDCTVDAAVSHGKTMPCETHERIDATHEPAATASVR
jgi:hypothetical protein